MDDLLRKIYYDPETGLQGALSLYQKAKETDPSIKRKDVEAWLKRQEVSQVHAPRKEVKHYYPIKSNYPDHIWQADLLDVSAQAHNNHGVNFLLVAIDIFTRYVWVRQLRNKESKTVVAAFKDILSGERKPEILMSDNGSEFISRPWRKLLSDHEIKSSFAEVGDHHRMGLVERINKSIRGAITKYMTAYKTKSYIGVLDKLIANYNNTVHSSIGVKPKDAHNHQDAIKNRIKDKEDRAALELTTFEIGDQVRSLKNKVQFEKGAVPKYSLSVHKVTGHLAGKRYVLENGKSYLYYQLKRVSGMDEAPVLPELEEPQQNARVLPPKRTRLALKKEGVEQVNVRRGLRERKPTHQVLTEEGERINW
jgi:transposase InsO family protein